MSEGACCGSPSAGEGCLFIPFKETCLPVPPYALFCISRIRGDNRENPATLIYGTARISNLGQTAVPLTCFIYFLLPYFVDFI